MVERYYAELKHIHPELDGYASVVAAVLPEVVAGTETSLTVPEAQLKHVMWYPYRYLCDWWKYRRHPRKKACLEVDASQYPRQELVNEAEWVSE